MTRGPRLRPRWLRPATVLTVVGLHLAGFTLARAVITPIVPSSAPILEIESAPEPVLASAEATPAPEIPPAEPPPPEPIAEPTSEPTPEDLAPTPEPAPVPEPASEPVVDPAPEPPPTPLAEPAPAPPPPAVEPSEPAPRIETVERPPPKRRVAKKPSPKKPVERPPVERTRSSAPSATARAAAEAASNARRAAAAAYASQVAAEFARHKHYPAAARAAGVEGTCVLTFTIGPSGALLSHAIVRSSGDVRLDAAVHAMAAASRFPPPPDGRFRSTVPVRFSIRR